ncbi:MAG: DUF3575 domain-containing protein [Cyclobacteriaceae bacterium]|nr:DUF3575 domain-containing protein [Cyclobacteriaceae bacterium]
MKKYLQLSVIPLLFFGLSLAGVAQENVFKINIFSPVVKTLNVSYERKLSATGSFQLGFFYTGYSTDGTKFSGIGITPEYRFYLSETEAPQGVYVAPFIRYQNFKLEEESTNDKGTLSMFGGGLIIGKQWIFKEKISLDIFIGPSYSSGNVKVDSGQDSFDTGVFDGFGVRTGVTLGFAF